MDATTAIAIPLVLPHPGAAVLLQTLPLRCNRPSTEGYACPQCWQ